MLYTCVISPENKINYDIYLKDGDDLFNSNHWTFLIFVFQIKPIVIQEEQRLLGETLEFRVNTSLPTDSDSQRHDGSDRTPHSSMKILLSFVNKDIQYYYHMGANETGSLLALYLGYPL